MAETVSQMISKIKFGELFSGPGGLALGADLAFGSRLVHMWASDYDPDACNTYRTNILHNKNPELVICQDVRTLDIDSLNGNIDGFAYGFPCNDFSLVGEQRGFNGKYGPLYSYGLCVLQKFKPLFFVAENVTGMASANNGEAFKKIVSDLALCGYDIFPNNYAFETYGIPQSRHRIIIVGLRKDLKLQFKIPSNKGISYCSCRQAIENPPISEKTANNELTKQSKNVVERLKYIKPGENAFTADLPPHLQLNVKGAKISQIYKRLDPEKPAYTVTGSGGGGTHIYHWKENRALTNRERARLQTFPDDFVFSGNKESVRKQIGMAVPPLGAKIVFDAIKKTLDGVEYPYMESNIPYFNRRSDA